MPMGIILAIKKGMYKALTPCTFLCISTI